MHQIGKEILPPNWFIKCFYGDTDSSDCHHRSRSARRIFNDPTHHRWSHRTLQRRLVDWHAMDRYLGYREPCNRIRRQHFCCATCWRRAVYLRSNNRLDQVPCKHSAVGNVHAVLGGSVQWRNKTKNIYWIDYKLDFWISPTYNWVEDRGC